MWLDEIEEEDLLPNRPKDWRARSRRMARVLRELGDFILLLVAEQPLEVDIRDFYWRLSDDAQEVVK